MPTATDGKYYEVGLYAIYHPPEALPPRETAEEKYQADLMRFASETHDQWRNEYQHPVRDGSAPSGVRYTPNEKVLIDRKEDGTEKWINKRDLTDSDTVLDICDIANKDFADLPSYWQEENLRTGKVSLNEAYASLFYAYGITPPPGRAAMSLDLHEKVQFEGGLQHEAWLQAHFDRARPEQRVSFDQLSAEERKKDIDKYKLATEIVRDRFLNGTFEVPSEMITAWMSNDIEAMKVMGYMTPNTALSRPPYLQFGEMELLGDGQMLFNLDIASDDLHAHGTFPMVAVAWALNDLRNNGPEPRMYSLRDLYNPERIRADLKRILFAKTTPQVLGQNTDRL